eukprot:3773543-Pleurochrysis_carterae.AAC.1
MPMVSARRVDGRNNEQSHECAERGRYAVVLDERCISEDCVESDHARKHRDALMQKRLGRFDEKEARTVRCKGHHNHQEVRGETSRGVRHAQQPIFLGGMGGHGRHRPVVRYCCDVGR